jgi:hypothetical protein
MLIFTDEIPSLVEYSKADSFVASYFLLKYDFLDCAMFKFGLYEEKNDSYKYFKLMLNIFYAYCSYYILTATYGYIYDIFEFLSEIGEQKTANSKKSESASIDNASTEPKKKIKKRRLW